MYNIIKILLPIVLGLFIAGCATTTTTGVQPASDDPLPVQDISNYHACEMSGYSHYNTAWKHLRKEKEDSRKKAQELYVKGVELLERSMVLVADKDRKGSERRICLKLSEACASARHFYPDEPQICRGYYEKAIPQLTRLMVDLRKDASEAPQDYAMLEYELARLYYLTGQEEVAFTMADSAWGHGYCNFWDDDFWKWLKDCRVNKNMQAKHFPPLPPKPTLTDRLLFPINLIPDMLSDAIAYTVSSFYVIGKLLTSEEPGWGIASFLTWPYGRVISVGFGVCDAWNDLPFWETTIIRMIKVETKTGNYESLFFMGDRAP